MTRRTKLILIVVPIVLLVALVGLAVSLAGRGPDPAQFEYLRQPQIRTMADERVLVVETRSNHEEEHIKGPGMFFKGNPEKYLTIIRYRIVKPSV